jgi:hypothetical protein
MWHTFCVQTRATSTPPPTAIYGVQNHHEDKRHAYVAHLLCPKTRHVHHALGAANMPMPSYTTSSCSQSNISLLLRSSYPALHPRPQSATPTMLGKIHHTGYFSCCTLPQLHTRQTPGMYVAHLLCLNTRHAHHALGTAAAAISLNSIPS